MNIIALWERPQADPQYGGTFCLLDDGRLLYLTQAVENDGRNADGSPRYRDTGDPDWSSAFDEDDRFDLRCASYFLHRFGARLLRKFHAPLTTQESHQELAFERRR